MSVVAAPVKGWVTADMPSEPPKQEVSRQYYVMHRELSLGKESATAIHRRPGYLCQAFYVIH